MTTSSEYITLPSLPKSRFSTLPRRYEETRPVLVQEFSHRRILNVGNDIHRRTLEKCDFEREMAVQAREEETWQKAEAIKEEAVAATIKQAKAEHERHMRKLNKAHDRAVKEEAARVKNVMQKIAVEQVEAERIAGEARLASAVRVTEARCHDEKLQAVAEAREEERKIAADNAAQVAREEKAKLEAALALASENQKEALANLGALKDQEREAAVAAAHKEEQDIAEQKLQDMSAMYESKLADMREEVAKRDVEIRRLQHTLTQTLHHKRRIMEELMETRNEFDLFIERTRPYEMGKSEYVLPPVKSFDPNVLLKD